MTHLEERVASDDSEEPLEALTTSLNDFVRETIRKYFSRERRDVYACRLAFKDVTERLKVAIPSPHN